MYKKLEEKLRLYEKSKPIENDNDLMEALNFLLEQEESLPMNEMDCDLIDAIVEYKLMLKNVDLEALDKHIEESTEEFLKKIKVEYTPGKAAIKKNKVRSIKKRWLMPLVAVLSILFTTVVAYAAIPGFRGMTNEAFQQLKDKFAYKDGNTEIIKTETYRSYTSFEDFIANEDLENVLLPYGILENSKLNSISFSDYEFFNDIVISFDYKNKEQYIFIKTSYTPEYDFSDKTAPIGYYDVWRVEYDGICQGDFIHNGNLYTIICSSYDALETIILNLELR